MKAPALLFTALAVGSPLIAQEVDPNLIAYDGMDYSLTGTTLPFNDFVGKNGGTGWGSPWSRQIDLLGKGRPTATLTSIIVDPAAYDDVYSGPIDTIGNQVHLNWRANQTESSEYARALATPITGQNARTYISFIAQRIGTPVDPSAEIWQDTEVWPEGYPYPNNLYPRGAALRIFNSDGGEVMQIGRFSETPAAGETVDESNYPYWMVTAEVQVETTKLFTEMSFVVLRIDHNGDETVADSLYLWVNPDLSQPENTATADLAFPNWTIQENTEGGIVNVPQDWSDIAFMGPWAGNVNQFPEDVRPKAEMLFDELRVGTTWESVTPGASGGGAPTFGIWDIVNGMVDTGTKLGFVNVEEAPWGYSFSMHKYVMFAEASVTNAGAWIFVPSSEAGPGGGGDLWANYPIDANGWVNTGSLLGALDVNTDFGDWVWSADYATFLYLPESYVLNGGAWAYVPFN